MILFLDMLKGFTQGISVEPTHKAPIETFSLAVTSDVAAAQVVE